MTVIQETVGSHKDFGVVGFQPVEHASYWVSPKSLGKFGGKRVIGIKYELLRVPKPEHPVKPATEPAKKTPTKDVEKPIKEAAKKPPPGPPPKKTKPKLHRYRVVIRSIATTENEHEVEATSAKEADELALKKAAAEKAEFSAEQVSRKAVGVRRSTKT